jgi:hypothetical protein
MPPPVPTRPPCDHLQVRRRWAAPPPRGTAHRAVGTDRMCTCDTSTPALPSKALTYRNRDSAAWPGQLAHFSRLSERLSGTPSVEGAAVEHPGAAGLSDRGERCRWLPRSGRGSAHGAAGGRESRAPLACHEEGPGARGAALGRRRARRCGFDALEPETGRTTCTTREPVAHQRQPVPRAPQCRLRSPPAVQTAIRLAGVCTL